MRNSGSGLGTLTLIFIVLKLVGVIDWSWWWVLSPTLIPIGLFIVSAAIGFGWMIYKANKTNRRWRKRKKKMIFNK